MKLKRIKRAGKGGPGINGRIRSVIVLGSVIIQKEYEY